MRVGLDTNHCFFSMLLRIRSAIPAPTLSLKAGLRIIVVSLLASVIKRGCHITAVGSYVRIIST